MNKKMKLDGVFSKALPVLQKIIDAGFEAYFVGGSVRDRILGLEVNDVDIATSAHPHEIKRIFKRTVDVGIEHGTIMVLIGDENYEITTFRTESTYKDYRRPDSVTFVRSLEEDLKRRDFTMNAIALDDQGNIIDPFNGLYDLDKGIIRAVGDPHERFKEDALRMMRAVRFSAQLDFQIESETLFSIRENAPLLKKIAIERIQVEFEKLLIGQWHTIGLAAMLKTKLYVYCPGLDGQKDAILFLIKDDLPFENARQAWTFLIYSIHLQSKDSSFNPRKFLRSWKLSNQLINESLTIFEALKIRVNTKALDEWIIFNIGRELAYEVEYLIDHLNQSPRYAELFDLYDQLPIKNKSELEITGHDFIKMTDVRPGKWMSEAIEAVLKEVVYRRLVNEKNTIIKWVEEAGLVPGYKNEE